MRRGQSYLRRKTFVLANRQDPKQPLPFLYFRSRRGFGKACGESRAGTDRSGHGP